MINKDEIDRAAEKLAQDFRDGGPGWAAFEKIFGLSAQASPPSDLDYIQGVSEPFVNPSDQIESAISNAAFAVKGQDGLAEQVLASHLYKMCKLQRRYLRRLSAED